MSEAEWRYPRTKWKTISIVLHKTSNLRVYKLKFSDFQGPKVFLSLMSKTDLGLPLVSLITVC